jgi:hypothetical protein
MVVELAMPDSWLPFVMIRVEEVPVDARLRTAVAAGCGQLPVVWLSVDLAGNVHTFGPRDESLIAARLNLTVQRWTPVRLTSDGLDLAA